MIESRGTWLEMGVEYIFFPAVGIFLAGTQVYSSQAVFNLLFKIVWVRVSPCIAFLLGRWYPVEEE